MGDEAKGFTAWVPSCHDCGSRRVALGLDDVYVCSDCGFRESHEMVKAGLRSAQQGSLSQPLTQQYSQLGALGQMAQQGIDPFARPGGNAEAAKACVHDAGCACNDCLRVRKVFAAVPPDFVGAYEREAGRRLAARIVDLEAGLERCEEDLARKRDECGRLESELGRVRSELSHARIDLDNADRMIGQLRRELGRAKR